MTDKKDGTAETSDAPPTDAPFQLRFAEELEKWRAEGCPVSIATDTNGPRACGARPHRTRILPKDADGNVTMSVDCTEGHDGVWSFKVPEDEMKAELKRQAAAAALAEANGGKSMDPMKARVTITLDLKTQEVQIDPFVPTPGVGLQLAAILNVYFGKQMSETMKEVAPAGGLKLPAKRILHPITGKNLVQ